MIGKEINIRAAKIADTAIEMLNVNGVRNAAVVVTYGGYLNWPLSIRTPMNDGFGAVTEGFPNIFQKLLEESRLQARYAQTVGGRSPSEQSLKLKKTNRSAASYGIDFNSELEPNFSFDPLADLTLVVTCQGINEKDTIKLSEETIKKVNDDYHPKLTAASYLQNLCLEITNEQLPKDRTAFSMIALPKCRNNHYNNDHNAPIIVCSQSVGEVVSPANYSIVEAKIKAVVQSGIASGPEQDINLSRIKGAIPVSVLNYGERIIAVGGLLEGSDDVKAIISALEIFNPRMQISLIEQLTR